MRKNVPLRLVMMVCLVTSCLLPAVTAAADPIISTSSVMALDVAGNPVGNSIGSSRLMREDTHLSYELTTSQLKPLNVYTVWWVLFKADNTTMMLSTYGGGAVALPNGTASFSGRLPIGALPAVDGKTTMVSTAGAMFDNPRTVRVLLVLREHGPIVLDQLAAQLSTFNGACPPNTCQNAQASNHAP